MSCRDEKNFDGVLCGECGTCSFWRTLLVGEGNVELWSEFKDKWYQSHLHDKRRKRVWKEEQEYICTGERYHNFITINLPDVESEYLNYYKKLINWDIVWLKGAKAVYELHTESGQHPHFHIISYSKRKKSTLIRDVAKKFKIEKNFVDVIQIRTLYNKHIDYINGTKVEHKQEYIDEDNNWRSSLNIPDTIVFP